MRKFLKTFLIIIGIAIVILIITNPSYMAFKEYTQNFNIAPNGWSEKHYHVARRRTLNFFVCSVHEVDLKGVKYVGWNNKLIDANSNTRFIGVLGNFYKIK